MKKVLLVSGLALLTFGANAQVANRALSFAEEGTVNCGQMPVLDNLKSFSLQLWLNPTEWKEGASILSRGEDFNVTLGTPGNLILKAGESSISASGINENEWTQVTFISNEGDAIALVNGAEAGTATLADIPESENEVVMGGGYVGLLDEVRVWNDALNDEMKMFDYFIENTINKWNPMYENLVAYYKMDNTDIPYVVEYKVLDNPLAEYDNHGEMSEQGVTQVLADNARMPYLLNAAYTANERFYDRLIPLDQYLLSNEIIILGADCVPETGGIKTRTPNNHAVLSDAVEYLPAFEGREGVVSFDGTQDAKLTLPNDAFAPSAQYTFESWVYLDEWTPGAVLFSKENEDQNQGIAIMLGENPDSPTILVRINGAVYQSFKLTIPVNEWFHLAVMPGVNPSSFAKYFAFYVNGASKDVNTSSSSFDRETSTYIPSGNDTEPVYIGQGLKGKLDETCLWNKTWSANDITNHMTTIPVPSFTKNVTVADMQSTVAYFKYDDANEPGFSTHSQDSWGRILKSAFNGYNGGHVVLSVNGSNGQDNDFYAIINNANKRKVFAQQLAELSKNYDGVELDLEWCYNATGNSSWANYALMSNEIRAALPEGKSFRVSMHNVSYSYPKDQLDAVDGFTIQQYGPQRDHFTFSSFKSYLSSMKTYGLPNNQLVTSYATTTSKGYQNGQPVNPIKGVKDDFLTNYVPSLDEPEGTQVSKNIDGYNYFYMTPIQVYKRAKYTRQNQYQGIFYWDMGNDVWDGTMAAPVANKNNMAKYCSFGLDANLEPVLTDLTVNHIGSESTAVETIEKVASKRLVVTPSPADTEVSVLLSSGESLKNVKIYSLAGALVKETGNAQNIYVGNLPAGVYVVNAEDSDNASYKTKFVKK